MENEYLTEFYYFLKFAKRRILLGLNTKNDIKDDWVHEWDGTKSDFSTGAERIIYAFFNAHGFGQPNSAPVGSDLFFETNDAFIHMDLKTVQTSNISDYTTSIFISENQNSYSGKIITSKTERDYKGSLPIEYNIKGVSKPCLTYFITILYDKENLNILNINLLCMPNGSLKDTYRDRPLRAGKTPKKQTQKKNPEARYNIKNADTFELLPDKPKRIKIVYFDEHMDKKWLDKLEYIQSIHNEQKE